MISGVNKYQMYASLFKNPLGQTDSNPTVNAIYNAGITAMYSSRLNNKLKSELNTYVQSFSNNLTKLQTTSNSLSATAATKQNPVMDSKKAAASNANVATAQVQRTAEVKTYKLSVSKIAQSQVNETSKLNANADNNLTTGSNTLKLTTSGKTTSITIDVKNGQTNRDVLKEISSRINQANTGVTSVYKEDKNGSAYLQINAKDTGTTNKFEISDENSNLAQKTGLNTVTQAAADAIYKVDGKETTSGSNTVSLDNSKVTVNLKAAGETTLRIGPDTETISKAVTQFVNSYNEMQNNVRSYGNYASSKAADLGRRLENAVRYNRGGLESIGISVKPNGNLAIDKEQLDNAITNNMDRVKSVLGKQKGAATEVSKAANEAMANPLTEYVSNTQLPDLSTGSTGSLYNYSSYAQKSVLIKAVQQGILFDTFT